MSRKIELSIEPRLSTRKSRIKKLIWAISAKKVIERRKAWNWIRFSILREVWTTAGRYLKPPIPALKSLNNRSIAPISPQGFSPDPSQPNNPENRKFSPWKNHSSKRYKLTPLLKIFKKDNKFSKIPINLIQIESTRTTFHKKRNKSMTKLTFGLVNQEVRIKNNKSVKFRSKKRINIWQSIILPKVRKKR